MEESVDMEYLDAYTPFFFLGNGINEGIHCGGKGSTTYKGSHTPHFG
jgi:hypothetical protein